MSTFTKDNHTARCPMELSAEILGGRWNTVILWRLHENPVLRYGELKRAVYGITDNALSRQLAYLANEGLIVRHSYDSVPPKVEYRLSDLGRQLVPALQGLREWGIQFFVPESD